MVCFEGSCLGKPFSDLFEIPIGQDYSWRCQRGELSVHELLNAEDKVVKHVQGFFFPKELAVLLNEATQNTPNKVSRSSGKRLCNVSYNSPLRKFNPVVVDGIMRVGGRL